MGDNFSLILRFLFLGFLGFLENCLFSWFSKWLGSHLVDSFVKEDIRIQLQLVNTFFLLTLSLKIKESLLTVSKDSLDCQ